MTGTLQPEEAASDQPDSNASAIPLKNEERRDSMIDLSLSSEYTVPYGTSQPEKSASSKENDGSDSEVKRQNGGVISKTANIDSTLMPPPSAPASMLSSIRASNTAPPPGQRHRDPFICSRLTAVAVTLFRQGKGKEAKALAQFTVDSIEQGLWEKYLQTYMSTETEGVDVTFVWELVEEAREELEKVDPVRAGFLAVLRDLIRNRA